VCSLHFLSSDYESVTTDSNPRRKRKRVNNGEGAFLARPILKATAIPSQFPNLPKYLTSEPVPERSKAALSQERANACENRMNAEIERFFESEKFTNLDELLHIVGKTAIPSGVTMHRTEKTMMFFSLEEVRSLFQLAFCCVVEEDCTFKLQLGDRVLPETCVSHITQEKKLSIVSEVVNIIAFLKSKSEQMSSEEQEEILRVDVSNFIQKVLLSQLEYSLSNFDVVHFSGV
jgi:hypothetical protein